MNIIQAMCDGCKQDKRVCVMEYGAARYCLRAAVQMLEQAQPKERSITDNCDYCGRSPGFCQCR